MDRGENNGVTVALGTVPTPVKLRRLSLLVAKGPGAGQRFQIDSDTFVIGKDPSCNLTVVDPTVSRRHLEIVVDGPNVNIRDLKSTNGTSVDGVQIKEAVLSSGSRIAAGNVELIFQASYETPDLSEVRSENFGSLVAANDSMRGILGLLRKVALSSTTVLLRGETGVGKSALARAIHDEGPRSAGPFVVFDCASASPTLIEGELFGAQKGAYTGAHESRAGACEQAQGGTLFIDEIEELPIDLQPKLLRVLEEKEVRRLGAAKPVALDVHLVAACKVDLNAAVAQKRFRQDLYYRIAVIDIQIPSLRDRREDIPLLADIFLKDRQGTGAWSRLTPALREEFERYNWPGNIRELRNVLERISCIGPDGLLLSDPAEDAEKPMPLSFDLNRPFKEAKEELLGAFEKEYLENLLSRSGGRIAPAAREAGLNRKYFYDLLRKHGLHGSEQ